MVKPRSKQVKSNKEPADTNIIDALADKLADKPYGDSRNTEVVQEEVERISISLPRSMRHLLEDVVLERKRAKEPSRSVSAITRDALEDYFKKIGRL